MQETKGSVGQVNISLSQCRSFLFPIPTIREQHEIVRRVESLFAFADRLEARLAAAQTAAEQLTPALLAKAFRGELVPQDPADEPASELLQRLAASRASAAKPKRSRTPRQPA
jgi:type I restriction enzyme S subunit